MGLQEGRRERLLPEELTEREKARQEERFLERHITLNTAYQKVRRVLLLLAILTAGDILLLPRAYKLSFPLASQAAQLLLAWGYHGHLAAGMLAALAVAGVYALLWWLSGKHYAWMIVAAGLFLVDMAGAFFMINMINYENTLVNGSAGLDTYAGNPGLGAGVSDYMTSFMITIFFHVVVVGYFIYGAVKGAKLRRVPAVSIRERQVERQVYHAAEDYTEHPEERTEPLRAAQKPYTVLVRANVKGMRVEVIRSFGVTALAVDGQVYNDQKGAVEPAYRLRACVNGVHLMAEHEPQDGFSLMTLYANGEKVGEKKRRL